MTQHLHATHVEGCFRCELSRDEMQDILNREGDQRLRKFQKASRRLVRFMDKNPQWVPPHCRDHGRKAEQ